MRVVRTADLSVKSNLETPQDIEIYLATMRQELQSILEAGCRARVQ